MIRAVIVDDEAIARRELRRLLTTHEEVVVVGEAKDLATARGLALRVAPDVAFLDIRLGAESGLDLLPDLDEATAVVFVTAYDDYAVRAFEAHALDYLLKPVDPARLKGCIERLTSASEARPSRETPRSPGVFRGAGWLFLQSSDNAEFIRIDDVSCINADGKSSVLWTADGRRIHSPRSLKDWIGRLPSDNFRRVHRSTIVNLAHVERVEPWSHYAYRLDVRGTPEPVTMSRRYAARLRHELGW